MLTNFYNIWPVVYKVNLWHNAFIQNKHYWHYMWLCAGVKCSLFRWTETYFRHWRLWWLREQEIVLHNTCQVSAAGDSDTDNGLCQVPFQPAGIWHSGLDRFAAPARHGSVQWLLWCCCRCFGTCRCSSHGCQFSAVVHHFLVVWAEGGCRASVFAASWNLQHAHRASTASVPYTKSRWHVGWEVQHCAMRHATPRRRP